ncbi:alpha/beta hydrolase [Alsobacter metallidurans]|uniref:Alpha/beta hydrolase n=1 Tax=Alsobacter metallidurans TaxID=340221 RepID=A0A917MJK6_9HYPH|nr:alpha/beta hydrolase [Alsobacter metallidurans]GGH31803.1 alpha/beta hydrolase [Alsobacter metallidurans]
MNRSNVLSALVALAALATPPAASAASVRNVVIVHGAFADGSGWRKVSDLLTAKGLRVSIVQEPLTSLSDDVAATRRILALQDGPIILVGHSYGGMVVTAAGDDPKVAGLVYVAAFQPDRGESLAKLADSKPVTGAKPDAIQATPDGFLYLAPADFPAAFAADLPHAEAAFMAQSQVFAARAAFAQEAGEPAWKSKPSWALVATQDRSINPDLEREMAKRAGSTVREVKASHAVYLSRPADVAALIVEAAAKAPSR